MLKVEFHCHTRYSKDSLVRPVDLVRACRQRGIQRVVVTDHNEIEGALEAQRLDPNLVIPGEEIMTTEGELLAAFVKERVPPGLTPLVAIDRLRQQRAFISVSHPFDYTRKGSWKKQALLEIVPYIDAIEIFNARCLSAASNHRAQEFARQHHLAGTVGSDAHTLLELGRAVLLLPEFDDVESLRYSLSQSRSITQLSSPFIHFTSRWATWYKKLCP